MNVIAAEAHAAELLSVPGGGFVCWQGEPVPVSPEGISVTLEIAVNTFKFST